MNTAIQNHTTLAGLGASFDPSVLAEPIDFYNVAGELYYRHAGTGRVFRLRLDLAAIEAENEAGDDTVDEAAIGASARIEEGPPDVLAHTGATPVADWQLADLVAGEWTGSGEDLADLVRDLADEADAHVLAYPLAELAPFEPIGPVLPLTAEIVVSTLAATGPTTAGELAAVMSARGVTVLRGVGASLEYLRTIDLVECDVPPAGQEPKWTVSPAGKIKAAKVRRSLAALAAD